METGLRVPAPFLLIMSPWQPHPRIVHPCLVFVSHNLQWKPQFSLSLIPLFSLYTLLRSKGTAPLPPPPPTPLSLCVYTLRGIPLMSYHGDGKYQAR